MTSVETQRAGLRDLPAPAGSRSGWPFTEAPDPCVPPPSDSWDWPRISIVIPSFEQGDFLEETLRSVLLQGYPDLELIVADGGSRDGSVGVLERYDHWISWWVSEPDSGQSDAINKGFARATGELVTFLGSDDVYEPGTLLDAARTYKDHPGCGAVVGAFRTLDLRSRRGDVVIPARLPQSGPQDLTLLDPSSWRLHQVSTFYVRAALDKVGRYVVEDLHFTMDRELLFRVALRFPIALSEECYGLFRRHAASKSVAAIVPMSREMGELHLSPGPHRRSDDATTLVRRREFARYHWARGQWKLARSGLGFGRSALALLRVLRHRPDFARRRGYWVSWLEVLGLAGTIRRLRR